MHFKGRKTITGKPIFNQTPSIKPSKTRKIIRRFHLLISKKNAIYTKLGWPITDNDEIKSMEVLHLKLQQFGLESYYQLGWNKYHPDPKFEDLLIKIQNFNKKEELITILGYIMAEIHKNGGLNLYQIASIMGQHSNRGGDSSKRLVEWVNELNIISESSDMRALEIGSLSSTNYISKCNIFRTIVRIDLNSNDETKILKQDFMKRPIPTRNKDKFDLISCSLVLNFVPTSTGRGKMLLRFKDFLRTDQNGYIFIVLPLSCLTNSRYINISYFCEMMESLGYTSLRYQESKKLIYFLFVWSNKSKHINLSSRYSKKLKIVDGSRMNNFAILLPNDHKDT